jgi:predicted MFS family arabinose efflux permease
MEGKTVENLNQKNSSLILVILWVALFFGGLSLFKLMPAMGALMAEFKIQYGQTGVMNTAVNWAALVLMAPMGFLARRFPPKWTLTVTMTIMGLAGIITATAPTFTVFLIGRVLEGGAQALGVLVGYSLAANQASKHRGLVLSIMVSASMVAQFALLNVGSRIMAGGATWRQLYLGIAIAQLVIMVIWALVCPVSIRISGKGPAVKPTKEQTLRVFKNASLWFISIANGIFLASIVGTSSYIPTYMTTKGLDQVAASTVFSLASLIGIFAPLVWGFFSDRFHTKRKVAGISSISAVLCFALLLILPGGALVVFSVLYGILPRSIVPMANASAPDLVENPADVPVANSVREIISRLVSILLGIAVGFIIESAGFVTLFIVLSVLMAVAGILWFVSKKVP